MNSENRVSTKAKTALAAASLLAVSLVPAMPANAAGDCVVDNFTNAVGSNTGGDRTLRFCLSSSGAGSGNTVEFDHGNTAKTIELAGSSVSRASEVTINGESFVTITLATGASGFSMITTSAELTVRGMTFEGGNAPQGAAIKSSGSSKVNVYDSTFSNNTSTTTSDAEGGGAIYGDYDVYINGSTFDSNSTERDGGAVFGYREVDIFGSVFTNNSALDDGGAVYGLNDDVLVEDSRFENNSASGGSSYDGNSNTSDGGAIYASTEDVDVLDSIFVGNEADHDGGAIEADEYAYSRNSTFTENTAGGEGGAIYVEDEEAKIYDSVFTLNTAVKGGAIFTEDEDADVEDSVFTLNSADDGGAIYADSDAYVYRSYFSGNTAVNDGGAVWASSDLYFFDSSFVSNTAGNLGGAGFADIDDLDIERSYLAYNTATAGGAVSVNDHVEVDNGTFYQNSATAGDGGAIQSRDDGDDGWVEYSTFVDNSSTGDGPSIYWDGEDLDLFASIFVGTQTKDQIVKDGGDFIDYGANVSSSNETALDHESSVLGISQLSLGVRTPAGASLGYLPTVPFSNLEASRATVTSALISTYVNDSGNSLPDVDQLGKVRTGEFLAGAQFISGPQQYEGPIVTDVGNDGSASAFTAAGTDRVEIVGERLGGITAAYIDGKPATIVSTTSTMLDIVIPADVTPGVYDLVLQSSLGNLTYLNAFKIMDGSVSATSYGTMTVWTTDQGDGTVKVYVKYPEVGGKLRIGHQTGGSGSYETIFVKTIASESDSTLTVNAEGSYIVRTIDLEDGTNRIRVSVDGDDIEVNGKDRPARYNE